MSSKISLLLIFFIFFDFYKAGFVDPNSNKIFIFMSPEGNDDTGDGSIEYPYLSLMKCQTMAESGDTVYIRGGTYTNFSISYTTNTYNYIHYFTKSGITYKAYESEKVVFDFEFGKKYLKKDDIIRQRVTGFMIEEGAENITFENFDCTRIPTMSFDEIVAARLSKNLTQSECFQSRGKNIRFNRINAYNNYGIGFYFIGLQSYNIAYRCDAYNNSGIDSATLGNADGFGAHGTGAEFIECRAWDNSDDNYDCINSYSRTIFDKTWAFKINRTNTLIQDGNGFKVGGWGKSADAKKLYGPYSGDNPPVHIVKNCIAASNKANGFYSNHQPGQAAVWFNNKSYNNKGNFDMTEGSETWELDSKGKVVDICGTREVLYFNFAFKYSTKLKGDCNMYGTEGNLYSANIPDKNNKFNTWNFRDITITADDFLSLDVKELAKERGPDGSLPEVNFMKLNPEGPNYEILKTIEEEMNNYELLDDGTIIKLDDNSDEKENEIDSENGKENEKQEKEKEETNEDMKEKEKNDEKEDTKESENEKVKEKEIINEKEKATNKEEEKEKEKANEKENIIENEKEKENEKDISSGKFYLDTETGKYEYCSHKITNCERCLIDNDNNFNCQECKSNYVFKHNNNIECVLKTSLEENNLYYTNDSGINYYSCNNPLYNEVSNCIKCSNKYSCLQCQEDYILVNNKTSCITQSSLDNDMFYYNPITEIYTSCSDLISLCHKCKNENTCIECINEGALLENDSCIHNVFILNNSFFKNETSQKYVSCSIINNCIKCTSDTECILCNEGYYIDNNKCLRNLINDDNGLSNSAILGIIFGCIGTLLIAGGVIYFLFKKLNIHKVPDISTDEKKDEKGEKIVGTERINIRSIRNVNESRKTFDYKN